MNHASTTPEDQHASPCAHDVRRYDFGTVHAAAKGMGMNIDLFMYGMEPLGLLLWWGDVAGMCAGVTKVLDAHAHVAARVRRGEATADTCAEPSCLPRPSGRPVVFPTAQTGLT